MGLYAAAEVVSIEFPFSDLTSSKVRPVVFLADVSRGDWLACQITSNPYIDEMAIPIHTSDFSTGGLRHPSYIRPGKLFTANESLVTASVGSLTPAALTRVRQAVIAIISEAPIHS